MTTGIARGSGAAPGPAPSLPRRATGALLVAAGLALAASASRAHIFDGRLPTLVDGAPAALGHDVGGDGPFRPFRFAVVGPPRGDSAALERALEGIVAYDVDFTVVVGGVACDAPPDALAMADVLSRNWSGLVLLGEGSEPAYTDPRIAARLVAPTGWAFLHRSCLFRGTGRSESPPTQSFGAPVATFDVVLDPDTPTGARTFAPPRVRPDRLAYEVVEVRTPQDLVRATYSVPRGASLASAARSMALSLAWPAAATLTGLSTLLATALVGVLAGGTLARSSARTGSSATRRGAAEEAPL